MTAPVTPDTMLPGRSAQPGPAVAWPALADRRGVVRPEVSVVVPTYNEAENLPVLMDRLDLALAHLDYEIVVVDDNSPDGTWRLGGELAQRSHRVRVLRRIGRRGLSSAVLEGMAMARGQVLAVIDADLQHDEAILPAMVEVVAGGQAEVCIGSRGAPGGSYGQFGPARRLVSWAGAQLARSVLGVRAADPMSGFFAVSRRRFELLAPELTGRGFKVLLEILARGPRPAVAELGYRFGQRQAGATKLGPAVLAAYLAAVAELALGRVAGSRFLTYGCLALVAGAMRASLWTMAAPGVAWMVVLAGAEAGIVAEFALHNRCTFARQRHRGWAQAGGPLLRFHLVSAYGLAALAGLEGFVQRHVLGPGSTDAAPARLVAAMLLAAAAVAATAATGYVLSRRLVWPR